MKKLISSITAFTGRLLLSDEYEIVMGDIVEAEEGVFGGFMEFFGLVVRRQLGLWKMFGPWLTLLGIALPATLTLIGISFSISLSLGKCVGLSGQSWPPREGLPLACQAVLLIIGSWTGGFVLASASRRTVWVNAALCLSLCLFCMARFHVASLSRFCLILFLLPSVLGVRWGMNRLSIRIDLALFAAVIATLSMTFLSMTGGIWSIGWILIWPAWYIVAIRRRMDGEGTWANS